MPVAGAAASKMGRGRLVLGLLAVLLLVGVAGLWLLGSGNGAAPVAGVAATATAPAPPPPPAELSAPTDPAPAAGADPTPADADALREEAAPARPGPEQGPPGATLSGHVVDGSGAPAGGAFVELRGPKRRGERGRVRAAVTADHRGAFTFEGLAAGPFTVRARVTDRSNGVDDADGPERVQFARASAVAAGTRDLRLVLLPPALLSGIAVDDAGAPIHSFELRLETARRGEPWEDFERILRRAFVGAEGGRFVVRDVEPGPWRLTAAAEGHGELAPVELDLTRPVVGQVFELPRASILPGVVLDARGNAVPDALVACVPTSTAARETWEVGERQVRTDAEGRFELVELPPGDVLLRAYHEDWASSADVTALAGPGLADEVRLFLRDGGRLTGEVYDAFGRPAGLVTIRAEALDAESSRETQSDAAGRFVFERLTPGEFNVVTAHARGDGEDLSAQARRLQNLRVATAEVVEGGTTHVVLGSKDGGAVRVHGEVTAGDRALSGARVFALGEGPGTLERMRMTLANEAGAYELVLDAPGHYTFGVYSATRRDQAVSFQASVPAEREHRLDFAMPAGSIGGVVVGPDGEPAPHVPVFLDSESDALTASQLFTAEGRRTDRGGRFHFALVKPGTYTVRAGGEDDAGNAFHGRAHLPGIVLEEGAARDDLVLELPAAGVVEGLVLDADGAPVPLAGVWLRDGSGRLLDPYPSCATDGGGRFRYAAAPPGTVSAFARLGAAASAESDPVRIRPGKPARVELRLRPGTVLVVRATDAGGRPLAASVSVRDSASRTVSGTLVSNDVETVLARGISSTAPELGPLAPGAYEVEVRVADGSAQGRSVRLVGSPRHEEVFVFGD